MAELGFFGLEPRVELIDGEIIDKVSPQSTPHAVAIRAALIALDAALGPGFELRSQSPITLADGTEPEPDITVARGNFRDYLSHHPFADDILLLIEISDSTLALDRGRKATAYAVAGVPEYWIVNIPNRELEIYRDAKAETGYASRTIESGDATVSLVSVPTASISVRDLLP